MLFIPQLEFEYKMNEANICVCGCDLGPVGLADGDHAEGPQPPHNWRPAPASPRIYTHTGDRHLLREAALNIKIQDHFTHICMICMHHTHICMILIGQCEWTCNSNMFSVALYFHPIDGLCCGEGDTILIFMYHVLCSSLCNFKYATFKVDDKVCDKIANLYRDM